ncbi:MAG TPA: ATPase, partial [Alcanivorax sp.]|nr:ATPase [Alcanivorax sp.]
QLLRDKLSGMLADTDSLEQSMERLGDLGDAFYSDTFLEPRPLLRALRADEPVVLLIDEIDKADQEFEAFLLELLSDFQISIPEMGTVKARHQPLVFLTSNDQRELSDALKRRCLHLYIPYPDAALERRILAERVPELGEQLRDQLVAFIQHLREQDMKKLPAISETLDWARALVLLHADTLEPELVEQTLALVLKNEQDVALARDLLPHWFRKPRSA